LPKLERTGEDRRNVRKNAPPTPVGRAIMARRVIDGRTATTVAAALEVCVKTV
jgi:hypothetical protein